MRKAGIELEGVEIVVGIEMRVLVDAKDDDGGKQQNQSAGDVDKSEARVPVHARLLDLGGQFPGFGG